MLNQLGLEIFYVKQIVRAMKFQILKPIIFIVLLVSDLTDNRKLPQK